MGNGLINLRGGSQTPPLKFGIGMSGRTNSGRSPPCLENQIDDQRNLPTKETATLSDEL